MKTKQTRIPALLLAAGLASTSYAQMGDANRSDRDRERSASTMNDRQQSDDQLSASEMRFVLFETLDGSEIVNANGEEIGTVSDLLLDRGSGEISDVIVLFDDFLGFGGSKVAVPFESLRFDRETDQVRLDVTPEQLETMDEFEPGQWEKMESGDAKEQRYAMSQRRGGKHGADPYAIRGDESPETKDLSGTIQNVVRFDTADDVEFVSINIKPERGDGELKRVILGPSWFVMAKDNAPMEGDRVTVSGWQLSDDALDRYVATEATIDDERLMLRDRSQTAAWTRNDTVLSNAPRLVLISEIIGSEAAARDRDAGEVSCAYIETRSGKVTLLGLDPNENLLGINDTEVLVPLNTVSIGEDMIRIDASPTELENAAVRPEEPEALASASMIESVYEPFGQKPAVLRERKKRDWNWDRNTALNDSDSRRIGG